VGLVANGGGAMAMLSEWQVNLTSDRQTGQVLAYVLG